MNRSPQWSEHLWFSVFNEKLQQRVFSLPFLFRSSLTCSGLLWKNKLKIERLLSVFRGRYKD